MQPVIKAFSLLELLAVLAILAIAIAMVIPRLSSGEINLLRAQVREAVAVLNYARRTAIVEGKPKTVILIEGKDSSSTDEPSATESEKPPTSTISKAETWISNNRIKLQWSQSKDDEKSEDVEPTEATHAAEYKILFYPEGGSNGGEVLFTYLDYQAKISINSLTGKIESEVLNEQEN
jgi:general secretion pathway protein H